MGTQKFYLELTLSYSNAWTVGGSCWLAGREEGATVAVLSDSSTEWVFPRTKPNNVLRPASAYHATHASLSAFRPSEEKLCASSYRARSSNSVLTVTGTSKGIEALFPNADAAWRGGAGVPISIPGTSFARFLVESAHAMPGKRSHVFFSQKW